MAPAPPGPSLTLGMTSLERVRPSLNVHQGYKRGRPCRPCSSAGTIAPGQDASLICVDDRGDRDPGSLLRSGARFLPNRAPEFLPRVTIWAPMARASHRTSGLFRMLERPAAYLAVQNILGGESARRRFVDEYVEPSRGARVLDVGCGPGSLLDFLPPDVDYVGFDFNPAYIERARRRYGDRGRFHCARVGDAVAGVDREFDRVVAVALLHHLDDDEARKVLAHAARVLRSGGAFLSIDATIHAGQSWIARALARADRGGRVRSPEDYRSLIETHFEDVEDVVLHDMLRIPYSHYIARARRPRSSG